VTATTGATPMFATTMPGLGPFLADEITDRDAAVTGVGFDGRADIVLFTAPGRREKRFLGLAVAEDVFVEVGRAWRRGRDTPRGIVRTLLRSDTVARALTRCDAISGRANRSRTFRVVVRVRQERSFRRTDLRAELVRAVGRDRPRWRWADPAGVEVWAVEHRSGGFVAGLRASDGRMRQHGGRAVERPGALRPVVAAAMVRRAGRPGQLLLDPCCGSGTILAEAVRAGWPVRGIDIDPTAVRCARRNLPAEPVQGGDVRRLDLPDGHVDACVSNLPFGRRYAVAGDPATWLRLALIEMARVTRPGGRVVLLAPRIPPNAVPEGLLPTSNHRLTLLGMSTTMHCFDRTHQT